MKKLVLLLTAAILMPCAVWVHSASAGKASANTLCWHHNEGYTRNRVSICLWPHLHQVLGQAYAFSGMLRIQGGFAAVTFPGPTSSAPILYQTENLSIAVDANHPPAADSGYYAIFTPGHQEFDLGLSCIPNCATSKSYALGKWPHLYLMYPGP
jgi:hypothetical protein